MAALINCAWQEQPAHASAWSVRRMARAPGGSQSTGQRWFSLGGLQPHRSRTGKLSSDPLRSEKVRDAVGLHLNPPDHAMVPGGAGKSRIPALNRTQPMLSLGLG